MKAAKLFKYGAANNIKIVDLPKPKLKQGEILVKVHYSTISTGESELRHMDFPLLFAIPLRLLLGVFKPRKGVFGQQFAGEVVEVHLSSSNFSIGDRVCGLTGIDFGAHAEFLSIKETGSVVKIPSAVTMEVAAAASVGGVYSISYFEKIKRDNPKRIVVYGAGGSIGTALIQLCKQDGLEITAIDFQEKHQYLLDIGASQVLSPDQWENTQDTQYDVIFDLIRNSDFKNNVRLIKKSGKYVICNHGLLKTARIIVHSFLMGRKAVWPLPEDDKKAVSKAIDLVSERVLKPISFKEFVLDDIVESYNYIDTNKHNGNVLLKIIN